MENEEGGIEAELKIEGVNTEGTSKEYQYQDSRIPNRKDEVMGNISSGLIETFDASKTAEDIKESIVLTFEDISDVKTAQFELLSNLLESTYREGLYEVLIEDKSSKEGYDTYSVGYLELDITKYRSINKIFDKVSIGITRQLENRMPYNLYKRLSSNNYLTEEEIRERYNNLVFDEGIEGVIKRKIRLYQ